jgi:DNA polymerase-4
LGKNGETLHNFANGLDMAEVKKYYEKTLEKSIGNSTTCPRDLTTLKDVEAVIYILAENVVARMREKKFWCKEISFGVRNNQLQWSEKRCSLSIATNLISEIVDVCLKLFKQNYSWKNTVRGLSVRVSKLCDKPNQMNFLVNEKQQQKKEKLELTIENLRSKFGYNIIKRGIVLEDDNLNTLNPTKASHTILSYF